MAVWKLRRCARCGGDIFVDRDMDGWYEQCFQCSYRNELRSTAEHEGRPCLKREGANLPAS
jgi:hypothetical protein